MRVLGIDPGTLVCGYGVIEGERGRLTHVTHGVVRLDGPLHERLEVLFGDLEAILKETRPEVVAVEGVFTHRNARSALVLGHARGVALLCAARAGLEVHEYAPATVKKSVVGTGRAEKAQVQTMVAALLKIPKPKVADAADALAIAITHVQKTPTAALAAVLQARPRRAGGGRR